MANPGAKFVSVNLNKSYGQQHHPSHHTHYNGGGGSGSYGRGRTGSAGGGGGMVVLSRNRGGPPKAVAKLSIPPPLNLPSLRKEHEKFDTSGTGGGPGGGAGTGTGSRPTSSGVGWTKPVAASSVLPEKTESGVEALGIDGVDTDGVTRAIGSYMPPSARSSGVGVVGSSSASRDFLPSAGKAMVLRGEDFPSLQAARPASSGTSQKQKDGLNQKQKQFVGEEVSQDKRNDYHLGPMVDVHPLMLPSVNGVGNRSVENGGGGHGIGSRQMADQSRKQENYFPDPLPLVRLKPRSDWADDERDTGHGFVERGRDSGYSKSESYWDSDFDLPRPSVLPHKPAQNQYGRWGQRDNEAGKNSSSEVLKVDPYPKDVRVPSREGREVNRWRNSPFPKDGSSFQEIGNDRIDAGSRITGYNNMVKENRYTTPHHGDPGRDGNATLYRDSTFGKRDYGLVGRQQQWNNSLESYNNRGTDHNTRDRHFNEQSNRYRGDNFQNNTLSKSSFASNGKGTPVADPILTMGRDKRYSKGDRHFSEDPFGSTGFDESDLFSGGLVGVVKRKKDAAKSTDFHDPVRESFEAELERVQKMQELERQKIIQEQERALEQTRREEEERQRRIREEEERQRRLEEEAREAAWRAEQERLDAIQKAEELRIFREEEKRRLDLEEERRKQAAKQKLLELEARIAKRQAEASKSDVSVSNAVMDEKLEAAVKEKEVSRISELDTWEDGDRLVEKVTSSGLFDSSAYSRPSEMSSRPYPPRDGSANFNDRGKAINSWRRDMFETGDSFSSPLLDQEMGHYSPRRDAIGGGRAVPRREFHGGAGYMPSRSYTKTGVQEPYSDEFGYQKDNRWNLSGDADPYGKFREMDSEFPGGVADDKYGDNGWGQGQFRNSTHSPYPDRLYPHPEANELYPYGRSRYSMRQPRVLPPPLASAQRTNFRGITERSGPSTFLDKDIHHMHAARSESSKQTGYYGNNQGGLEPSEIVGLQQENATIEDQKLDNAPRCDSQSSLSVSSPPTSPPHLSHDELDESGDSRVTSAVAEGQRSLLTGSGSVILNDNSEKDTVVLASDSISVVEDEEWTSEIDDALQQQEEYDEEEDGYREEDDVREGDGQNLELNQKFEEPENVVLGFDEGVEVVIPSDDFEKSLGTQEISFDSSVSVPSNSQSHLPMEDYSGRSADNFSEKIPETESTLLASVNQPVGLPTQQTISSSGDITVVAGPTSMPSLSSAGNPADVPIQLQFGLFSGPSLIPSPVPSIQIGSIQMPLHNYPPVGPSIAQMHPSQPPMFQFGQLRYTSAVPHGILPMPPQSVSFVQPTVQGHFNLNKNVVGSVLQPDQNASVYNVTKEKLAPAPAEQSNGSVSRGIDLALDSDSHRDNSGDRSTSSGVYIANNNKNKSEYGSQAEVEDRVVSKSYLPSTKGRGSENQFEHVQPKTQFVSGEKRFSGQRGIGMSSGGRGRRFAYAVKNTSTRSSSQAHDFPADSNGYQRRPQRTVQRTEFRVRENYDRRQAPLLDNTGLDDKSSYMGNTSGAFTRSGSKRGTISNRARTMKQRIESEPLASGSGISQEGNSGDRATKDMAKSLQVKSHNTSHSGEANLRRNVSEEDVDAPLQSGVVRVFKQPGIEAPSDEDDFIQVRSKRQVLNDRREQREKEIKAKSRIIKPPRKPRSTNQNFVASRSHHKLYVASGSEGPSKSHLDYTASESPRLDNDEVSKEFMAVVSKPLAPIGIPAVNSEAQAIKHPQSGPVSVDLDGGTEREADLIFESKNKAADNVQSSSTTWTTSGINQQVMSLTQTQLDEAMKPARYDSHISTVGGHSCTVSDPILPTPSILTKDKTFSSGASPINSLLAGEKIQFGRLPVIANLPFSHVDILPQKFTFLSFRSSRVVSHGIGAPGSNRLDVQMTRNFPVSENDSSLFFEKEKHPSDSCAPLQDSEAEAEAAASAVAVAAISSDEIVGNGLGSANLTGTEGWTSCVYVAKFHLVILFTGTVRDQQLASQSRGDELLSVSLPADLSVETTPISLWPPLPSPHSHFPGGPPSHFPFYEINPMLGGPIFAFSPHEESSGTKSHPQSSTTTTSGPLGNWQHHSGVDSFYGPPAGFHGPFISPPGGIPGVQGPPHMVVYNHFAPVGQYGQVGLSFMGTTYIPSGKQADWKHTPTSSVGEGDINNMNMNSVQHNAPIQHLAPGSPLLPMGSPLPMFDVSPFQTAPDLSVQARWGHIPTSQIHPVPVSRPLHPQIEGALPSQVSHGHTIGQAVTANRFSESRCPAPSDSGPTFTVASESNVASFPSELGLVASSGQQSVVVQSSSSETGTMENRHGNNGKHPNAGPVKAQFSQKNASTTQQQGNSSGYNYRRGDVSHRNNAGNEWSHRRMGGFHGRNQSNAPASKVKQIYVAKQTPTGSSTN
ncbi:hypothetical protein ACJIZ3_014882 [Penstemon smallii]|uniref:Uncharacterized protein n=1 Tax=Penstemon smallii TaxID=265156 RepID=A0ABD3RLP8_9LAMI